MGTLLEGMTKLNTRVLLLLYVLQFMAAVRFYLFFLIIGWAIFNATIVPLTKKHHKKPQEDSLQQKPQPLPPPANTTINSKQIPPSENYSKLSNDVVLLSEE